MTAITTAARLLREAATELKNAHTLGGDWGNEHEALDAYNEHMAAATTLEHMARQCLTQIEEPAGAAPAGPAREEIAVPRAEHGITSSGRGVTEFEQVDAFVRAVLQRWGAAPALEAPAGPTWDRVRMGLTALLLGFARNPHPSLDAAEAALDAATEPDMPLAGLRTLAAAPQAPAAPVDDYTLVDEGGPSELAGAQAQFSIERKDGTTLAWVNGDKVAADELMHAIGAAPAAPAKPFAYAVRWAGIQPDEKPIILWPNQIAAHEDGMRAAGQAISPLYEGAAPVAPAVDAWQPIESAPVGKFVLVAAEFDGPGDWRIKIGDLRRDGIWHVLGASWKPTRWMPLPPVPGEAASAFTHAELLEIQRAVSEFEDCNETDIDDALLLRAVQAGYLECSQYFHVADKSKLDSDTAAAQAKEGGA